MLRKNLFCFAVLLLVCRCACPPCLSGADNLRDAEALAGRRAAPALIARFGGLVENDQALQRCRVLGSRLTDGNCDLDGPWHFHLLDSDKINAFSLPGGLIFITQGLYARIGDDDHQLAAIIAHEMGHIINKDSLKAMPCTHEEAIEREMHADRMGYDYLKNARFDTSAMAALLADIKDEQPEGWAEIRIAALSPETICSR